MLGRRATSDGLGLGSARTREFSILKFSYSIFLCVGLAAVGDARAAGDWRFELGVAYASGIRDVADHYEDNLRLAGFDADVDVRVPVGLGGKATYLWSSNVRADLGLGPMFFISGDVNHFELPISATIGFSFLTHTPISPYIRAGAVYHYVDGDQYSGTDPGVLAAVGIDFSRLTVELATDRSEVELDALACTAPSACRLTTRKLHSYEFIVGVYYRF